MKEEKNRVCPNNFHFNQECNCNQKFEEYPKTPSEVWNERGVSPKPQPEEGIACWCPRACPVHNQPEEKKCECSCFQEGKEIGRREGIRDVAEWLRDWKNQAYEIGSAEKEYPKEMFGLLDFARYVEIKLFRMEKGIK